MRTPMECRRFRWRAPGIMSMINKQALTDFPTEITDRVATPCYLISRDVIKRNCEILDSVQKRTGAKILLALKAFAMPAVFPLISEYLHGVCASGPIEAQMGERNSAKRFIHTPLLFFRMSSLKERSNTLTILFSTLSVS